MNTNDYKRRARRDDRSIGVKLYVFPKRCPRCGTLNHLRRKTDHVCKHCLIANRRFMKATA